MTTSPITMFWHCRQCVEEWRAGKAKGQSPGEYSSLEVGTTPQRTLMVWCKRHDRLVGEVGFDKSPDENLRRMLRD